MKKISIIKQGQITNQATFQTDELLNQWLTKETANLSFGYPERDLVDTPLSPVSDELKAIAISTEQVEIEGNTYTSYKIPSEFTYEIEDITAQIEAEQKKQQIEQLEAQITPRRIREALLANDYSFIEQVEQQIAAIRSTL